MGENISPLHSFLSRSASKFSAPAPSPWKPLSAQICPRSPPIYTASRSARDLRPSTLHRDLPRPVIPAGKYPEDGELRQSIFSGFAQGHLLFVFFFVFSPPSSRATPIASVVYVAVFFVCLCASVMLGCTAQRKALQKYDMSDTKDIETTKPQCLENTPCEDGPNNMANSMPSHQEEEEAVKKKYGGLLPKKPPLISKDHERAFFDSADWALGKQGAPVEKPKGPLEALRPKLQPTPHQQVRSRRSVYAPTEGEDGSNAASEDLNSE